MAKNYIQPGVTLTVPAPAAYASGEVVQIGEILGIAAGDAAVGEDLDVVTGQVWTLPKVAAEAFTVGEPVFYDAAQKLATATATDNEKIGVCVQAAAVASAAVKLRLSTF